MGTADSLSEYKEKGFTVLQALLPPGDVLDLKSEIENVFRPLLRHHDIEGADSQGEAFERALERLFDIDMKGYLAAAKATQLCPRLHAMAATEPILDRVRSFGLSQPLIAVRPVVHILSDALQVPGGYHRTPPHQDWRSVQGSLDALVVWLPLVDVDPSFGALEVMPGSHRQGLLPTHRDAFGNVVDLAAIDSDRFVPVSAKTGDAVVFSMFTVHRTGREQRDGIRWAVSLRYNNADAPGFAALGYPNPFLYKSQDDLLFEDYPTVSDIASVFEGDPPS